MDLLASLGVLFAALPAYINRAAWAEQDAQGSTLALVGTWLEICLSLSAALVSLALACLLFWKKANDAMALFLNVLPISFTLAIMRSHLWDIDVIIRRTLVYSTLTLTLGLVYVGCILMTRTLIAPLIGGSDVAIVASTLVIRAVQPAAPPHPELYRQALLSPQVRRRESAGSLRRNRSRRDGFRASDSGDAACGRRDDAAGIRGAVAA